MEKLFNLVFSVCFFINPEFFPSEFDCRFTIYDDLNNNSPNAILVSGKEAVFIFAG